MGYANGEWIVKRVFKKAGKLNTSLANNPVKFDSKPQNPRVIPFSKLLGRLYTSLCNKKGSAGRLSKTLTLSASNFLEVSKQYNKTESV